MANSKECTGQHRIFVPEVVGIPDQGKIIVITVCTCCDTVSFHEKIVAPIGTPLRLFKEEKTKG